MNKSPCIACGGTELQLGFIPDAGDQMSNVIMGWHEGEPEDFKIFGMKTGNVKTSSKREVILAYKCASCGFLHLYADG
jgi:predicted nucleic-acid-binding Zn-ribbon protein